MDISDILKIKWVRDEEFPEKWYDSEICLHIIVTNNNPLASIFTNHGLNVLIVNSLWYSENGKDFRSWDRDRKRAAKNIKIIAGLIRRQEKYIVKAEKFLITFRKLKTIGTNDLKGLRNIFSSLWCIFLTDLGKPFAFEVEKKLSNKKLTENQQEKIRNYLAGLKAKIPSKIEEILNDNDLKYFEAVRKSVFIDNYAANLYSKIDSILQSLFYKRFKINPEDLIRYSFTELEELVKKKIKLRARDLEERGNFRIMAQVNGYITMLYGRKSFEKIKSVLQNNMKRNTNNFSGIVASRGIAKGYVKIVKTIKDMEKVNVGNVLVASTTRPDLMPALKLCSAIVTDVGGITSHAAIISRELKVPCIVGTKIATQVLKDGDLVEVNANKGIIKILK